MHRSCCHLADTSFVSRQVWRSRRKRISLGNR